MNTLSSIFSTGVRVSVTLITLATVACGGGNSSTPPNDPVEFEASEADFTGYTDWTLTDYSLGPSNMSLGGAHQANNSEFARAVFENDMAQTHMGGEYPMGSIILKETFTTLLGDKVHADMGGMLAMVKRGGEFNPDNNGWEWFMLSPEGAIVARGPNLMDGACNACHAKGTGDAGVDYTFNKPSEFVAQDADFANYQNWTLIESATGNSPANSSAHTVDAIRKTYKKQASVSPYFEADAYPIGTVIVKEIALPNGSLGNVYAMVKRGGNFSPSSGGWEWFLLNNAAISSRSGNAGLSVCTTCHINAGDPTLVATDPSYRGSDFVFYKKDDPVPLPQ